LGGVLLKKAKMSKSKYYYDYTRNMSQEQIADSYCRKPICIGIDDCDCIMTEKFEWEQTITVDETYLNFTDVEQS